MKETISNSKAICFDLFHTLVSFKFGEVPGKYTHEILGIERKVWDDALFNRSEDRLRGKITDAAEIVIDLALMLKPDLDRELIRKAAFHREDRFQRCLKTARPEVLKVLKAIGDSGRKVGLVSNADVPERSGWEDSPLAELFDAAIFSCDVGFIKPEPEIYLACLNALGVDPQNAFFVGDGGSRELMGAKRVGMTTILTTQIITDRFPDEIEKRKKHADFVVSDLDELTAFLT
jgi:putative hydrolase of the HAD superfamily